MADSCAALPDRNRFLQDTDMSTVPALALDHVLNLMMIKTMRMRHAEHVPNTWEIKKAYEILDEEPKGKLPFVRTRCRRTKDTKMHNKEIRWKRADWIRLAENRVQWCSGEPTIIKFWVLYEAGSILIIYHVSLCHTWQPAPPPHVLIQLVQPAIKERAISCNNGCWFMLFVHHHGTHQYAMFYIYFTHWFFFYLRGLCNNAVCITRHSSANWGTNPTCHTVTEKCHETLSLWISIVLGNIWTTHIMNTSLEISYYAKLCSINP